MKKVLTLLLSLSLIFSFSVTASAASPMTFDIYKLTALRKKILLANDILPSMSSILKRILIRPPHILQKTVSMHSTNLLKLL